MVNVSERLVALGWAIYLFGMKVALGFSTVQLGKRWNIARRIILMVNVSAAAAAANWLLIAKRPDIPKIRLACPDKRKFIVRQIILMPNALAARKVVLSAF